MNFHALALRDIKWLLLEGCCGMPPCGTLQIWIWWKMVGLCDMSRDSKVKVLTTSMRTKVTLVEG